MRTLIASLGLAIVACGGASAASAPAASAPAVPAGGIALGNTPPGVENAGTTPRGVNGRLPPEDIQKVVRANFGRMRSCYEAGLGRNPKLAGTVSTKFVIDTEGRVSSAQAAPNTKFGANEPDSPPFPDADVTKCVVDVFATLRFPKPDGGIVTVVYPIIFNPGD